MILTDFALRRPAASPLNHGHRSSVTCQLLQYSLEAVRRIISDGCVGAWLRFSGGFSALRPHGCRASAYTEWLFRRTVQSPHGAKLKVNIWRRLVFVTRLGSKFRRWRPDWVSNRVRSVVVAVGVKPQRLPNRKNIVSELIVVVFRDQFGPPKCLTNSGAASATGSATWTTPLPLLSTSMAKQRCSSAWRIPSGDWWTEQLPENFRRDIGALVKAETSAIFMLLHTQKVSPALQHIHNYGGMIIHTTLSPEQVEKMTAQLAVA